MKKPFSAFVAILILGLSLPGAAQQPRTKDKGAAQLNHMVELYSQATMGWEIERRCQHLGSEINPLYALDYAFVSKFMTQLLGAQQVVDIQKDAARALDSDPAFDCGVDTVDFAGEAYRITRNLAASIRAILAKPNS